MIVESVASDSASIGARAALHLDTAFRHMMRGPGAVQNETYLRLVTGEAHALGNVAIVSEPGNLAATLEAIEPLLSCGAPASAIFPRGVAGDVARAVKDKGFAIEAQMPAMAVDIDRLAATALPPGYRWLRVGKGADGRAWAEAFATGYQLPRSLGDLFSPEALGVDLAPDAALQFFAVRHDDRLVATSLLYLADGLAGIYCVSTRPDERHQGLGAHATAQALRVARQLGYRVGVLQSSTAGHGVYLKLGFGDVAQVPMLIRMPA